MQDGKAEEWRPMVGYEGWYEVSNQGRVKRVRGGPGARVGKILKSFPNPHGYLVVDLYRDGRRTTLRIHRLVAFAFLPPPLPGQTEVCHANHIETDNRAVNLEWGTRQENEAAKDRAGRRPSKLTDDDVREIRRRYAAGETRRSLADEFGVSEPAISQIVCGKLRGRVT